MILCYHKIDLQSPSHWWVTADTFDRQLADLQAYDVVPLDEYDPANANHAVITFDGVYANVAAFAGPLLEKWGYPFELFVIGDWIGRENTFDQHIEPPAWFADLDELESLVARGGRIQWHTRTHSELSNLDSQALARELTPSPELVERFGSPEHLQWFAYPHGEHDARVRAAVESRFDGAVSVVQGAADDRYARARFEVDEAGNLSRSTASVIIPNHNYGRFLPEAVESVLQQSGRVDEVLIIDDASTDGSQDIVGRYSDQVRFEINEVNLGIVENFRKAVSLTTGDYVVLLGADNRMRSDFVARAKAALDAHPEAAVAYTDIAIFGPRSHELARKVQAEQTAAEDVYLWRFPDPTPERVARISEDNFVHGSSMYRRTDYEAVGGYRQATGPEDHDLFTRMLSSGRGAVRVPHPVLEYRQHSEEQANTRLGAQLEVARQARLAAAARDDLRAAQTRIAELEAEVHALATRPATDEQELNWLRQRHATLTTIEQGGWWRLRARLLPLLRVGRKVAQRLTRDR